MSGARARDFVMARPAAPAEHGAPMRRRRSPHRCSLAVTAALLAAACAAAPISAPDAEQRVAAAESQVAASSWEDAASTLEPLAGEACPKRLRDRRDVALARALRGQGELWDAFLVLEKFPDRYPHSELRPAVVEMVWEIGEALARSDRGFLFFWSDARAGRTVLEHLTTRHPDTPRLADALRLLGDIAFADGDYELAQQRFRDLMLNRPESEWFVYAQYRFAMSIVASLEGPDYDLDRMQLAVRELREFLRKNPENPEIARAAEQAVATLLEWQVERHLQTADFYRTVGNDKGELLHLERAVQPEYATTSRHREALERLAERAPRRAPAGGSP
jgi:outer membrane protein assembly factor BamD (BamD/ComL family)